MNTKIISTAIGILAIVALAWIAWPGKTTHTASNSDSTAGSSEATNIDIIDINDDNHEKGATMSGKPLVIYFSRADENYEVGTVDVGNTALLAKVAIDQLGADSFEIKPVTPYPAVYDEAIEQATAERNAGARPDYIGDVDISGYDTIFFGYPIWWGDLPMIVYNFVEDHDWSGKIVIPFNTHEGSGNAGTYQTLGSIMTGATLRGDGFNLAGHVARTSEGQARMKTWLTGLGY